MNNFRFRYNYAILDKNGLCYMVASTPRAFDDPLYIDIGAEPNNDYLGKNYIGGAWYERVQDTDKNGNPLDTYTDMPWTPEG